ncbi:hypothetical protein CTEN210_03708 [Chaetoceros tenuissimus]|uniref:Leucine-rich repeat domain-containing protein n=1 Tax=Chaetoceros tenuissimus TaxID=426638 RepID=A0AAD3CKG5_9STRA|nr:hypothetical protein CTEN210_03708 [Chaetoceros tenuissimus]
MRIQTEEWKRFVPGVRYYRGKRTLFYNGEKIWEGNYFEGRPLVYNYEERDSWQVVIVLPGVEVISEFTFFGCENLKTVIMSDTVKRIENDAFNSCKFLHFIKLSRNLEYIGGFAFWYCESLTSIFIPPTCREIGKNTFWGCKCLSILGMPQNIELGDEVFKRTALIRKATCCEVDEDGWYESDRDETVIQWIKSINNDEIYALHRSCSSFNPLTEIIHGLVKRQGIESMRAENAIGITPSQYLEANTFADISEKEIINRFVLNSMGELF